MDNYTPPLTTQIQKRKQNSTLNTHACAEPIEVIKLQSANQADANLESPRLNSP